MLLLSGLTMGGLNAQTPSSTPSIVNTGAASGAGSLADAVTQANANPSSSGPYVIQINAGLTIQPGAQMLIALNQANPAGLIAR